MASPIVRPQVIAGQIYGRLVVLSVSGHYAMCACACGRVRRIYKYNLLRGFTRSCNCLRTEQHRALFLKHGHCSRVNGIIRHTPEYRAWYSAKRRCYDVTHHHFKYYGGRGITMSAEWRDEFIAFFRHMGPKPSPQHSLDRIDNNGPYTGSCPAYPTGNCRWATAREQRINQRRSVHWVTCGDERLPLTEMCGAVGVHHTSVLEWMQRHRVDAANAIRQMIVRRVRLRQATLRKKECEPIVAI